MEKLCQETCILCNETQSYKINFAGFHGVCQAHASSLPKKLECQMCKSTVPVLELSLIELCEHCKNPCLNTKPNVCGHKVCFNCSQSPDIILCYDEFSLKYSNSEKPNPYNKESEEDKKNSSSVLTIKSDIMALKISQTTNDSKPNKSFALKASNEKIENFDCEYCKEAQGVVIIDCNHKICNNCYNSICPICKIEQSESILSNKSINDSKGINQENFKEDDESILENNKTTESEEVKHQNINQNNQEILTKHSKAGSFHYNNSISNKQRAKKSKDYNANEGKKCCLLL